MIPPSLMSDNVIVRRRQSTGRDALNNPNYGSPTDGAGWYDALTNFPVKLAFSQKGINFAPEGERVSPLGTMYYNDPSPEDIKVEDRILTEKGTEYVVIAISRAILMGGVVDHYEAKLQLP